MAKSSAIREEIKLVALSVRIFECMSSLEKILIKVVATVFASM